MCILCPRTCVVIHVPGADTCTLSEDGRHCPFWSELGAPRLSLCPEAAPPALTLHGAAPLGAPSQRLLIWGVWGSGLTHKWVLVPPKLRRHGLHRHLLSPRGF